MKLEYDYGIFGKIEVEFNDEESKRLERIIEEKLRTGKGNFKRVHTDKERNDIAFRTIDYHRRAGHHVDNAEVPRDTRAVSHDTPKVSIREVDQE